MVIASRQSLLRYVVRIEERQINNIKTQKRAFLNSLAEKRKTFFAAIKSITDKMQIKKPIEGRYNLCSKIISSGMKVDSIARFKKNQRIPNDINGLDFVVLRETIKRKSSSSSDKKVAGGEKSASEIKKSCSRLSRPGSGRNKREI